MHSDLPSPPLSAHSPAASPLPQARSTALRPGSSKESTVRNYVESKLLEISGRFERRFQSDETSAPANDMQHEAAGYSSFAELAKELDGVVDIIWVSGSRKSAGECSIAGRLIPRSCTPNSFFLDHSVVDNKLLGFFSFRPATYSAASSEA